MWQQRGPQATPVTALRHGSRPGGGEGGVVEGAAGAEGRLGVLGAEGCPGDGGQAGVHESFFLRAPAGALEEVLKALQAGRPPANLVRAWTGTGFVGPSSRLGSSTASAQVAMALPIQIPGHGLLQAGLEGR